MPESNPSLLVDNLTTLLADLIPRCAGSAGEPERGVLTRAVVMPRRTFARALLHDEVPAMAA